METANVMNYIILTQIVSRSVHIDDCFSVLTVSPETLHGTVLMCWGISLLRSMFIWTLCQTFAVSSYLYKWSVPYLSR